MKNRKLCGILPALLTAFCEDGVDTAKVASFTKHLADTGVHGLYVGGSSGEMILMTENERKILLETVMESVGDRLTVIAELGIWLQVEDSYTGMVGFMDSTYVSK